MPEPNTSLIAQVALAAEYYNMPLYAYLDHLTDVRQKYGEKAAKLDLEYALTLRELTIKAKIEAAQKRDE